MLEDVVRTKKRVNETPSSEFYSIAIKIKIDQEIMEDKKQKKQKKKQSMHPCTR